MKISHESDLKEEEKLGIKPGTLSRPVQQEPSLQVLLGLPGTRLDFIARYPLFFSPVIHSRVATIFSLLTTNSPQPDFQLRMSDADDRRCEANAY